MVGGPISPVEDETDAAGANDQGETEDQDTNEIATALNEIEAAIRDYVAQQRQAQGQPPADHEIRDLYAQERMALWAERMFWATVVAVILTFAGVLLILGTLHYTRKAALSAAAAAEYTKQAVKAAQDAAKEARRQADSAIEAIEFTRRSERPYFLVTYIEPGDEFTHAFNPTGHRTTATKFGATVKVTVKNVGARPGFPLALHMGFGYQPPPMPQPEVPTLGERAKSKCIAPNEEISDFIGAWTWEREFVRELTEFRQQLCVFGYIRYMGTSGTYWRTGFAFEYSFIGEPERVGFFVPSSPRDYWYDIEETSEQADEA